MPVRVSRLAILLIAAVALGMVALAVFATDWAALQAALGSLQFWQLAVLLGLSAVNYLLRALRWRLCVRALGLQTRAWGDILTYLGGFGLTLTPGRLGELVRLRWLARDSGAPLARVAPMGLVDRASDLLAVALLLALSVSLASGLSRAAPVALVAALVAVLATRPRLLMALTGFGWRMTGRAGGKIARAFATIRHAARQLRVFSAPAIALPAIALGLIGWFAEGYAFALLLSWMGAPIDLWLAIGIFVFAMLGGGATGLPGGLGGAEAALLGLLGLAAVPLAIALPATLIIRATTLWFAIVIGLVLLPFAERAQRPEPRA
ncbi:lysylphosphatidylglycerol synthase transmembrane domain-containing protein [Abyssibius alkaniclasticus]|uniref:lysylphosphatidylglycerol synthase transmembrane domain-containing protein n=1 Tax=Abyssibius alkaniclasticus TaxID=2881234 RepID=UPI004057E7B6